MQKQGTSVPTQHLKDIIVLHGIDGVQLPLGFAITLDTIDSNMIVIGVSLVDGSGQDLFEWGQIAMKEGDRVTYSTPAIAFDLKQMITLT